MVSETRRVGRALRPVSGEEGILEIEVPTGCGLLGPTHLFGPDFSQTGGWVGPTQSIGWSCLALIFGLEGSGKGQSGDKKLFFL